MKLNNGEWEEGMKNSPCIDENSIITHGVIVNTSGVYQNVWMHYPNIYAALGFLRHVFIPSAFILWLCREQIGDGICIPTESAYKMLHLIKNSNISPYKDVIPVMFEQIHALDQFWSLNEVELKDSLKKFSASFFEEWNKKLDIFFYFNIFFSAKEAGEYVVTAYEDENIKDMFETDMGLTRDEWLNVVQNVNSNQFMSAKFTHILTNRITNMI